MQKLFVSARLKPFAKRLIASRQIFLSTAGLKKKRKCKQTI